MPAAVTVLPTPNTLPKSLAALLSNSWLKKKSRKFFCFFRVLDKQASMLISDVILSHKFPPFLKLDYINFLVRSIEINFTEQNAK